MRVAAVRSEQQTSVAKARYELAIAEQALLAAVDKPSAEKKVNRTEHRKSQVSDVDILTGLDAYPYRIGTFAVSRADLLPIGQLVAD